jgi:hypothetical protein
MVVLRGDASKKCKIYIEAGTDDGYSPVSVLEAKTVAGGSLTVSGNAIKDVELNSKGEARISVRLENNDRYALKVAAYEN